MQAIKSKSMELKKSPKVNLENKRVFFLEIGFLLALMFVFAAFEYRSYEKRIIDLPPDRFSDETEEFTPVVYKKPEPPKPPPMRQLVINLVDNNDDVDDLPEINMGTDQEEVIPDWVPQSNEEEIIADDIPFVLVPQEPAEFPGGLNALYQYLNDNIQYPDMAKQLEITGTVYIEFIIEGDGSISNIEVVRSVGGGCSEEAIRVIENMPKWKPATQNKRPAKTKWTLPIKFNLRQI